MRHGSPNEAHLSSGDSGGAIFIQEGPAWKLAGINYSVDGPFFETNAGEGALTAAFYDTRDFYYEDPPGTFHLITGTEPVPSGFYSTRISSKLLWIYGVIDPNGDANGNGISNAVDYALSLNSPAPLGAGAPTVVKGPGFVGVLYRRLLAANSPSYVLQQSTNLRSWATVTPTTEIQREVNSEFETIEARVATAGNALFLRVAISPAP